MSAPPGDKDILFGRGRTVFQHLGNQTFRKFIDLHIEDYVHCAKRQEKSNMVREIVHDLYESGYRFMKPNDERMFVEIDRSHALGKVGHALRDRSPLLDKIRVEPQKTRQELKAEGISVLRYSELLIRGKIPPLRRRRKPADAEGNSDYPFVNSLTGSKERIKARAGVPNNDAVPPGRAKKAASAAAAIDITDDDSDVALLQRMATSKNEKRKQSNSQSAQQFANARKKTINDIVVPAMKNGNLPYGGYWKFFPLPEVQDSIDLGPTKGWKLKLEPISFAAKPIILDVV